MKSRLAIICWLAILPCLYATGAAVDALHQTIAYRLLDEPPTLDSMMQATSTSTFILGHVCEGLLRFDQNNRLAPGVAESWQSAGNTFTFQLRRSARWNDGQPVTAHDFVFAWRKTLDPATASEYGFILFPIKNASAISSGKSKTTELGVQARDDHTLVIELERPCAYFLSLLTFQTYLPVREKFYHQQGDQYAADARRLLYNGPFMITEWVHAASLNMKKNPCYWDKDNIPLQEINIPHFVSNGKTLLNLFQAGNICMAELNEDTLQEALQEGLALKRFLMGAIAYIELNHRKGVDDVGFSNRPTSNLHFRKALQAIISPDEITNRVVGTPGNAPLYSIFPSWVPGVVKPLAREYPLTPARVDVAAARAHLAMARQELGLREFPELIILADQARSAAKIAQYVQYQLLVKLGIHSKINQQSFKARLDEMARGRFDIVFSGWGPDYYDGMTFADLFASWNENNRGRYNNPLYDKLVAAANSTFDQQQRARLFQRMHNVIQEDAALIPWLERGEVYLQHPQLSGVTRRIIGMDPDFRFARVLP